MIRSMGLRRRAGCTSTCRLTTGPTRRPSSASCRRLNKLFMVSCCCRTDVPLNNCLCRGSSSCIIFVINLFVLKVLSPKLGTVLRYFFLSNVSLSLEGRGKRLTKELILKEYVICISSEKNFALVAG